MRIAASLSMALVLLTAGCRRSNELAEDKRVTARQAYNEGVTALEGRKYTVARDKLQEAISSGAVYSGSIVDARVRLAVATAGAGDLQTASMQLDDLEQNAPELDLVFAAKAYVLAKQGKAAESRAALAKARQYNRSVQEFKD